MGTVDSTDLVAALSYYNNDAMFGPSQSFSFAGAVAVDFSGTAFFIPNFAFLTGAGAATPDLLLLGSAR
jgi:hypothetical protein